MQPRLRVDFYLQVRSTVHSGKSTIWLLSSEVYRMDFVPHRVELFPLKYTVASLLFKGKLIYLSH